MMCDDRTCVQPAAANGPSLGRECERAPPDPTEPVWSAMLTWRAPDISRMESVRVQLSGKRIKANGRIVAAAPRPTRRSAPSTNCRPTRAEPPSGSA